MKSNSIKDENDEQNTENKELETHENIEKINEIDHMKSISNDNIIENTEIDKKINSNEKNKEIITNNTSLCIDEEQNINKKEKSFDKSPTKIDNSKPKKVLEGISNSIEFSKINLSENEKIRNHFKKVIIQFHGGGFVAQSSSYHQGYLRKISKNLNVPIFAVDYRLAPSIQFPKNIYDCIAGIFWVFQFVKDVLGGEVEEYILAGDSAGGNLAVAITQWLIESNISPLPIMLSLHYPVLSIR